MSITFTTLKKGFCEYLQELNNLSGNNYVTNGSNSSIFMYTHEFKDYLKKEFGADNPIASMNLQDIMKLGFDDEKLNTKDEDKDNIEEKENVEISDILNDLLTDENMRSYIDVDGDNEFSEQEESDFLDKIKGLDDSYDDVSIDDLMSIIETIKDGTLDPESLVLPETKETTEDNNTDLADTKTDSAQPSAAKGSSGTSGGGGGSYSSGGGGGASGIGGNANSIESTENNIDNMSEEELKKELQNAKTNLAEKQQMATAILDGSDSDLSGLQEEINTKEKEYQEKLSEVAPKLSEEYEQAKTELDTNQQSIAQKQADIYTKENEISSLKASIANLDSQIQACESSISSLSSQTNQEGTTDVSSKIKELDDKKTALEAQQDKETDKLNKAEEEKGNLSNELSNLEGQTLQLQEAVNQIQEKINKLNNEELTTMKSDIDKLKSDYETKKITKASEVQKEIDTAQAEVDKIQAKLTEVQNNQIANKAKNTGLNGTYNYKNIQFDTVIPQEELDKLVQNALKAGAANIFDHSGKCLGFSDQYCLTMLGLSDTSFSKLNLSNAATNYKNYTSDSKEKVLAKVKEQLDKGVPSILQVSTQAGTRHYVAVVGCKSSAGSTLKESDLLIWDSYDGKIKTMKGTADGTRHMITGYSTGNKNQKYGYQMYFFKG